MNKTRKRNKEMENCVAEGFFNAEPTEKCTEKIKNIAVAKPEICLGFHLTEQGQCTTHHNKACNNIDNRGYFAQLFKKEKF